MPTDKKITSYLPPTLSTSNSSGARQLRGTIDKNPPEVSTTSSKLKKKKVTSSSGKLEDSSAGWTSWDGEKWIQSFNDLLGGFSSASLSGSGSSSIEATPSIASSAGVSPTGSSSVSTSKADTKKKADKKYIETIQITLTGELVITITEKTNKVHAGDTIQLGGLGKYLSGLYFVKSIKRSLSSDSGYSVSMTVIKNGFADGLKATNDSRKEIVEK